jgi:hypothetical protein
VIFMKKVLPWLVVLLVLSMGLTIWWQFRGKEIFLANGLTTIANIKEKTALVTGEPREQDEYFYFNQQSEEEIDPDPKEGLAMEVVSYYDPLLEFRLTRDIARENSRLGLEKLAQGGNNDAALELMSQNRRIAQEEELEGILRAKGYGDVVISIEDGLIKVVANDLNRQKVEAIGELLFTLTSYSKEQIVLTSI